MAKQLKTVKEKLISLRDMDMEQVILLYKKVFNMLVSDSIFETIEQSYRAKYINFLKHKELGYNSPTAMGRDKIAYGRNIIYGWFCEELFVELLKTNLFIKQVELYGSDKLHDFVYLHNEKNIKIEGSKTVEPDIEITLKSEQRILLELKTASKDAFTIKIGNVESLFKSTAFSNCVSVVLMLDLNQNLYHFEDLSYFENTKPFLNASMENQLCYDFPRPATDLSKIVNLNFETETNLKALENIWVKKFKLLKLAIDKGDKKWEKIIDAKIKLEKLEQSRTMTIVDFDEKIQKSLAKFPEIRLTWEEIEIFLNQNKELF